MWEGEKLTNTSPCCMMFNTYNAGLPIENMDLKTPEELFNSKEMQQLRKDALQGVRNPVCEICWKLEDNDQTSFRMYSLPKGKDSEEEHDHEEHDHDEEPKQGEYADDMCDGCGKPGDECECEDCEQHGDDEGPKPTKMRLKIIPKKSMGYDPVGGDKKEILNALMNRYKSL